VRRQWIVIALVLMMGLQGSTVGYAAAVGPHQGMGGGLAIPCAVHAAMSHSSHDCCHSAHSVPAACLAHCAGAVALLPSTLTVFPSSARIALDTFVLVSRPSEHPAPVLRPPIV